MAAVDPQQLQQPNDGGANDASNVAEAGDVVSDALVDAVRATLASQGVEEGEVSRATPHCARLRLSRLL